MPTSNLELTHLNDAIRELQNKPQAPVTREQAMNLYELITTRSVIGGNPLFELLQTAAHQITSEEEFQKFLNGTTEGKQLLELLPKLTTLASKVADLKMKQKVAETEAESSAA